MADRAERRREYEALNRERITRRQRERRAARREEYKAYMKAWRERNRERIRASAAAWREKNADRVKVFKRRALTNRTPEQKARDNEKALAYHAKHREERKAAMREYRALNRERLLETQRTYYARNRDDWPERRRRWMEANPEKHRAVMARHARMRRRGARSSPEHHSLADERLMFVLQSGVCYYCDTSLQTYYEVDHIVPLSSGGDNGAANICLACRTCNRSKSANNAVEWALRRRIA